MGIEVEGQPTMRAESDDAAQRLSNNNQRSFVTEIFKYERTHDVLSELKISVTKPPWLLFYTVEPNGYVAKMAAADPVGPRLPAAGSSRGPARDRCVGVTAL